MSEESEEKISNASYCFFVKEHNFHSGKGMHHSGDVVFGCLDDIHVGIMPKI
jgi:hypothetical protein